MIDSNIGYYFLELMFMNLIVIHLFSLIYLSNMIATDGTEYFLFNFPTIVYHVGNRKRIAPLICINHFEVFSSAYLSSSFSMIIILAGHFLLIN